MDDRQRNEFTGAEPWREKATGQATDQSYSLETVTIS